MAKGYGMRVLACAASRLPPTLTEHQGLRLPTWVPDWRIRMTPKPGLDYLDDYPDLLGSTQTFIVRPNGRLLLWGWILRPCDNFHIPRNPQCSTCRFVVALYEMAKSQEMPAIQEVNRFKGARLTRSLTNGRPNKDVRLPGKSQMSMGVCRKMEQLLQSSGASNRIVIPGDSSVAFSMMEVQGCKPRCYRLTANSRAAHIHQTDLDRTENNRVWKALLTTYTRSPGWEFQIA